MLMACTVSTNYALTPGDIAIVGFNFDNPDSLAFVALDNIAVGTEIKFTDNGWNEDNTFRTGESIFTYTTPDPLAAGTIISPDNLSLLLAETGDQILVYQGAESNPSFIYGLNSEESGWQTTASSSNSSALPLGLINGQTGIAFDEFDNGVFDTTVISAGSKEEWLQAIANPSNWTFSNSALTLPSGTLAVTAVPEPSTYATLLGIAAIVLTALTKKRSQNRH